MSVTAVADPPINQPNFTFANNGADEIYDIPVSNLGEAQTLSITGGSVTGTDGGLFSITSGFPIDILPGEDAVVTVQFTPGGIDGAVGATLELVSNHGGTPGTTTTSLISGEVRDPWISTVDSVDLGSVDASAGLQPFSVTVSNLGAFDDLVAGGAFLTGPDALSFDIVTDFSTDVPAGGNTDVDLTFDPGGVPGTYTATLELDSNDATESPRFIPLTVEVPNDPEISARSRVVAGAFPPGSGPQSFTVRIANLGPANNLVLSPAPSLSDASNFSINSVDSPIAAGADGAITLTFDPLGGSGTFETTLTVESNDILNPSIDIDIIAAVLPAGTATPMLHYAFEEGSGATSASAVNATAGNTLNFSNLGTDTDWGNGPTGFGKAAKINNREGLVGATDPTSWALPSNTSDLTLAFWVNFDGGASASAPSLVGALANNTTDWKHHYMVRTDSGARTTGGFMRGYDETTTVTVQTLRPASTAVENNQWTHVATTFNATTGELNFYCDGFLLETVTDPAFAAVGWPAPSYLLFSGIGNPGTDGGEGFSMSGLYDEIQIYDSVLSQAEIVGLIPAPAQSVSFALEIVAYDSVAGTLSLTATGIPAGQTFHLEQSTELQNWGSLSPPFDFDSTTAQPFVIPVSGPVLFIQSFEGTSP